MLQPPLSTTKAINFSAKVILDNRISLDYTLAERGGIGTAITISCCIYINTFHEVETHLESIRKEGTWLQQVPTEEPGFNLFSVLFSWLPA